MFKRVIAFILVLTTSIGSYVSVFATTKQSPIVISNDVQGEVFDPGKMDPKQRQAYYDSINKQVEIASQKYGEGFNKEWFREELIYILETENSFKKIQSRDYSNIIPFAGSWIPDVKVRNDVAAAAINVAIDAVLISAGVGSAVALAKKVGMKEAKKLFTRTLKSKLKAWGLGTLAVTLPTATDFIFNLLDPGTAIAEFLDSKDSYPDNGYIDLIL